MRHPTGLRHAHRPAIQFRVLRRERALRAATRTRAPRCTTTQTLRVHIHALAPPRCATTTHPTHAPRTLRPHGNQTCPCTLVSPECPWPAAAFIAYTGSAGICRLATASAYVPPCALGPGVKNKRSTSHQQATNKRPTSDRQATNERPTSDQQTTNKRPTDDKCQHSDRIDRCIKKRADKHSNKTCESFATAHKTRQCRSALSA